MFSIKKFKTSTYFYNFHLQFNAATPLCLSAKNSWNLGDYFGPNTIVNSGNVLLRQASPVKYVDKQEKER